MRFGPGGQFGRAASLSAATPGPTPTPTPTPTPSAAWNPDDKTAGIALSNSNRTFTAIGGHYVRGVQGRSTGKRYFEFTAPNTGAIGMGLTNLAHVLASGWDAATVLMWFLRPGYIRRPGAWHSLDANIVPDGDVGGCGVDLDARMAWFRPSVGWLGDPEAGTGGIDISAITGDVFPLGGVLGGGDPASATVNLGATGFAYATPGGFSAWAAP